MSGCKRMQSHALGVLIAGTVGVMTAGAMAADDPIAARQALMKANGFAAKQGAAMVKGEAPYDAAKAELVMRTMNAVAIAVPKFFPEDSQTGGDTEASAKVWEDMAGFLHEAEELEEHSAEGIEAAKENLDAFKAAFAETTKYCKSCHEAYRVKKN